MRLRYACVFVSVCVCLCVHVHVHVHLHVHAYVHVHVHARENAREQKSAREGREKAEKSVIIKGKERTCVEER